MSGAPSLRERLFLAMVTSGQLTSLRRPEGAAAYVDTIARAVEREWARIDAARPKDRTP